MCPQITDFTLEKTPDLDISLFAHINNDAHISGTRKLEGNNFETTVAFLNHFVSQVNADKTSFASRLLDKNKFAVLEKKLIALTELEKRMLDSIKNFEKLSDNARQIEYQKFKDISNNILKIPSDNNNNSIFFPGGWNSFPSGHAMLYEFRKDKNGDTIFLIYNSGAGLNFHSYSTDLEKVRYNPVKAYRIPKATLDADNLTYFLKELIKPRIEPLLTDKEIKRDRLYNEDRLYQESIASIACIGGVEIDPKQVDPCFNTFDTPGQIAGTCSEKVLHQLIKPVMGDKNLVNQFLFCFKKYSIALFFDKNKKTLDAKKVGQLQFALANLSRMLIKHDKLFSSKEVEENLEFIKKIKLELNKFKAVESPTVISMHEQSAKIKTFTYGTIEAPLETKELAAISSNTFHEKISIEKWINQPTIAELKTFITEIEQLKKSADHKAIVESIEGLFLNWPLSHPLTKHPITEVNEYIKCLKDLLTMFGQSCTQIDPNGNFGPKRIIALFSVKTLLQNFIDTNFDFTALSRDKILIKTIENCPYLATKDPLVDKRLKDIIETENVRKDFAHELYYYKHFLNSRQELKKYLIEVFNKNSFKLTKPEINLYTSWGIEAVIALLHFLDEIKSDNKYPEIVAAMEFKNQAEYLFGYLNYCLQDFKYSYLTSYSNTGKPKYKVGGLLNQNLYYEGIMPWMLQLNPKITKWIKPFKNKTLDNVLQSDFISSSTDIFANPVIKELKTIQDYDDYRETLFHPNYIYTYPEGPPKTIDQKKKLSKEFLTKENFIYKMLWSLRAEPNLQISMLLDFFYENLDLFKDPDFQLIFEKCLFQPGLLNDWLKTKENIDLANNFINFGIAYFSQSGKCSINSLFCYKLKLDFNAYLAKLNLPDSIMAQQNIDDLEKTLRAIPIKDLTDDLQFLVSQLMVKINFYQCSIKSKIFDKSQCEKIVEDFLIYKRQSFSQRGMCPEDENEESDLSKGILVFFKKHEHYLVSAAQSFCAKHTIYKNLPSSAVFKLVFPKIEVTDSGKSLFSIDLQNGTIWIEGKMTALVPSELSSTELYKTFYGEKKSTAIIKKVVISNNYTQSTKIEIIDDKAQGCFLETPYLTAPYVYQCQKSVNSKNDQYELQCLMKEKDFNGTQIVASKLGNQKIQLPLPATFFCDSVKAWRNIANESILIERMDKNFLIKMGAIKELDSKNNETGYELFNLYDVTYKESKRSLLDVYELFSSFEDKSFTEIYVKNNGNVIGPDLKIYFPRYGLELHGNYNSSKKTWEITLSSDKSLVLKSLETNCLPQLAGILVFKNDKEELAIAPNQEILKKENLQESEYKTVYPHFAFDVTNSRKSFYLEHESAPTQGNVKSTEPPKNNIEPWRYIKSENYFMLPIDKKTGNLKTTDVKSSLYLAYLNLNQFDYVNANEHLQNVIRSGKFSATKEELEFIAKIIKSDKIKNPQYAAIKSHALSILVKYIKNQNLSSVNYEISPLQYNSRSELCAVKKDRYYHDIYNKIDDTIHAGMNEYNQIRKNIPSKLRLSKKEEFEILYFLYSKKKLNGPLEKRYQHLKAKFIGKELAFEKSNSIQSATSKVRQQVLEGKLKKNPNITINEATLQIEDFVVNTAENFENHSEEVSSEQIVEKLLPIQKNYQNEIPTFGMTDEKFLYNLKYCYDIARDMSSASNKHELKNKLKNFCEQVVLATANLEPQKQHSLIPTFAAVLLKVIHNSNSFMSLSFPSNITTFDKDLASYFDKLFLATSKINLSIKRNHIKGGVREVSYHIPQKFMNSPLVKKMTANDFSYKELDNTTALEKANLIEFIKLHRQEKATIEKTIIDLIAEKQLFTKPFEEEAEIIKEVDRKAGALRNGLNKKLQESTLKFFASTDRRAEIFKINENLLIKVNEKLAELPQEIIAFANKRPENVEEENRSTVQYLGELKHPLAMNDLNKLYVLADMNEYKRVTHLNEEAIIKLHQKMTDYIQLSILSQVYTNRQKTLLKCQQCKENTEEFNNAFLELGNTLIDENLADIKTQPEIQFFQKEEGMLIYPTSIKYLDKLLKRDEKTHKYINEIVQLIMGGGKSKVISPMTGLMKADGTNLVCLQVKSSLFNTNYADCNATSLRLFNQEAVPFTFDRNSPTTSDALKKIYHTLNQVAVNKNYIVTTGESLQSLELKYLELLLAKPEENAPLKDKYEWKRQIKWLEKSLLLIKTRCDRIIDEIHDELNPKKVINYTLDTPTNISYENIQEEIDLFYFFEKVNIDNIVKSKDINLFNLIAQNHKVSPEQWAEIFNELAEQIINNSASPVFEIINKMKCEKNDKEDLKKYLLGKSDNILAKMNSLSSKEKDKIAFLKGQISTILPFNITKNLFEHYGPSKQIKSPILKRLAIPYKVSDTPNEKARFNFIEFMNYTVLMNLKMDLPSEFIDKVIEHFIDAAKIEILDNPNLSFDKTISFLKLTNLLKNTGIDALSLYRENKAHYNQAYETLKNNIAFKKHCLKEFILPQIKINPSVLSSNTQNLSSMTRTTQGMTGTPSNYRAMHQDFIFNVENGLGVDGETIDHLMEKHTAVHFCDNNEALLANIINNPNTRAIIDAGAFFKGISNENVARKIAECVAGKLKYVLYFDNNEEVLYALNVNSKEKIRINTTDERVISKMLGCSPNERFTFYDQGRITGTDIVQAEIAHAFVTISDRTHQDTLLQAVKRMRQLHKGQSVSIWCPAYLKPRIVQESLLNGALDFVAKNQQHEILELHLRGALQKYKNAIRENLLSYIYATKDPFEKAELLKAFKKHFIIQYHLSHFKNFGAITSLEESDKYFKDLEMEFYKDWKASLSSNTLITHENEKSMLAKLEKITFQSIQACAKKLNAIKKSPNISYGINDNFELDNEVEVENEVESETEQELEFELMIYEETATPNLQPNLFHMKQSLTNTPANNLHSLNEYLAAKIPTPSFKFSNDLHITTQFGQTTCEQQQFFSTYLKPIEVIMMVPSHDLLKVDAIILTKREAAKLIVNGNLQSPSWLCTPRGTLLHGKLPDNVPENYISLLEQIRFLNADCKLLAKQKEALTWLQEDTSSKLKFLEKYILPLHPLQNTNYKLLKGRCDVLQKIFSYIASHPTMDFSRCNWNTLFPGYDRLLPEKQETISQLILAYSTMNKSNVMNDFSLIEGVDFKQWSKKFPEEISYLIKARFNELKKQNYINMQIRQNNSFKDSLTLKNGFKFGEIDFNYYFNELTPLQFLISTDSPNATKNIRFILENKSGIDKPDINGKTTFQYLLESYEKNSLFTTFVLKNLFASKVRLIERGSSEDVVDLINLAVKHNNNKFLKCILECYLYKDNDYSIFKGSQELLINEVLLKACSEGDTCLVEKLIELKADLNMVSSEKQTPLMNAIAKKHTKIGLMLLNAGAKNSINSQNSQGESALMLAAGHDDLTMAKALLDNGAKLTLKDNSGITVSKKTAHSAMSEMLAKLEIEEERQNKINTAFDENMKIFKNSKIIEALKGLTGRPKETLSTFTQNQIEKFEIDFKTFDFKVLKTSVKFDLILKDFLREFNSLANSESSKSSSTLLKKDSGFGEVSEKNQEDRFNKNVQRLVSYNAVYLLIKNLQPEAKTIFAHFNDEVMDKFVSLIANDSESIEKLLKNSALTQREVIKLVKTKILNSLVNPEIENCYLNNIDLFNVELLKHSKNIKDNIKMNELQKLLLNLDKNTKVVFSDLCNETIERLALQAIYGRIDNIFVGLQPANAIEFLNLLEDMVLKSNKDFYLKYEFLSDKKMQPPIDLSLRSVIKKFPLKAKELFSKFDDLMIIMLVKRMRENKTFLEVLKNPKEVVEMLMLFQQKYMELKAKHHKTIQN